jgi:hypothetical protein
MPSEALAKWGAVQTLTITLASLANNAGRISDVIDNSVIRAPAGELYVKIRAGTAPTGNTPYKIYLIRRSNGSPDLADHNLGTADAAVSAEPNNAELIGSIVVSATLNADWYASFRLYDLSEEFSIVVWNATGQALNATGSEHVLQYRPVTIEAQ